MKKTAYRTKFRHDFSNKIQTSITQRRAYIWIAYHDHQAWLKYLPMFHDLFTSLEEAKKKAKTYSVMVTCNYLLQTRGCEPQQVFESFEAEVYSKLMHLHPALISYHSQFAFMVSLCKIR